jgi:phosphoglycolate phosphatase
MPNPILVFDLDGTLADTAPDLLDSLNHCLSHDGMEPADPVALKAYVGSGSRVMIERAFQARQRRLLPAKLDELQSLFLEHYVASMPGKTRLYDGVEAMLDYYAAQDFILAVCTNKMEGMSVRLLETLGISHRFAAICGSDTFAFRKPDPRHLFETIKLAGGDASRAVMLGDSRTDIDTAKAAGIPVIAVDFGYSDRHVSEFEPSHIISHFNEVTPDLVASMLRAAAL